MTVGQPSSIGVLTRRLDDRTPLVDLGLDELLVFGTRQTRVGDDDCAERLFALDELGVFQRGAAGAGAPPYPPKLFATLWNRALGPFHRRA